MLVCQSEVRNLSVWAYRAGSGLQKKRNIAEMQTKEVVKVQYSGKCSRLIQQSFTDDLDDHELLPLPSVLKRERVHSSVGSVNVYHITP